MLPPHTLKTLHLKYPPSANTLAELGNPTETEMIESALGHMESPDRNIRVLMLRVLAHYHRPQVAKGVLQGLSDAKRRVREVAVKSCGKVLAFPKIVARLSKMLEDESETPRIRGMVLPALAGRTGVTHREIPPGVARTLQNLSALPGYRSKVFFQLVQVELTNPVAEFLRDFVKSGTRQQAIMATRALCGYQVVNIGHIQDDLEKEAIVRTGELAAGNVYYWRRRKPSTETKAGN